MVRVGVIGYGYWGPNLVRNFSEAPGSSVAWVSDLRPERLEQVRARFPSAKVTVQHEEVLRDPSVDAIVIATPVSTHFKLALQAIEAGKHVLVEKPMTATVEEGRRLIEAAAKRKVVLMVDHTFVYTGAVRLIRDMLRSGRLGRLYYYDSVRVNLGMFQHDVSVLWDLAVHDLAIMDYLLGASPLAVAATGAAHLPGQPLDVAYLTCYFPENLIAHFHVNWLTPVKVRRTLIGGDKQMIVYDDLEPSEKIKIYDSGVVVNPTPQSIYQIMIGYRTGDMWAPKFDRTEALSVEAAHFLDCIRKGERPVTDGEAGLRVVRILEAADRSLAAGGGRVEVPVS